MENKITHEEARINFAYTLYGENHNEKTLAKQRINEYFDQQEKWEKQLKETFEDSLKQDVKLAIELVQLIKENEKIHKLLELYKAFYNSLDPTIEYIDDEDYNEEYLDISGATSKTIEIVKQIKELEDEK